MGTSFKGLAKRCAEMAFEQHLQGRRKATLQAAVAALLLDPFLDGRRGLLSIALRSILGSQIVDLIGEGRARLGHRRSNSLATEQEIRDRIVANPMAPSLHQELGLHFLNRGSVIRAYACLRTALTLARLHGGSESAIQNALSLAKDQLGLAETPTSSQISRLAAQGDPYRRLRFLAEHVAIYAEDRPLRLLDIGGGDGFLSVFLPQCIDYLLVEPYVNGLSGLEQTFDSGLFDVVISSHVLEHIATDSRGQFLTELIRISKHLVLVLGPFAPAAGRPFTEQSILAATGTEWAREHLACGLPQLDDVRCYLDKLQLRYQITPNADARVMYWQFLATHFASLAGENQAVEEAAEFFHKYFDYRPADLSEPHDFLVQIWLS